MAFDMARVTNGLKAAVQRGRWLLLAVGLTVLLQLLMHAGSDETIRQPVAPSWPRVETLSVHYGDDNEHAQVRLYGQTGTPALVNLTAAVAARVEATPVLPGEPVKAGDLLVSLERRDLELRLAQREADIQDVQARMRSEELRAESEKQSLEQQRILLGVARRDWERLRTLGKAHQISDSQLDAAQSALARQRITVIERQLQVADQDNRVARLQAQKQQAESARAQAQLDLERSQIRADFDGWLTRLDVAAGKRVRPGDVLAQVYPAHSVEIKAQVPNRYLAGIRAAQAAGRPVRAQLEESAVPAALYLDRMLASVQEGRGGVDAVFRPQGDAPLPVVLGQSVLVSLQVPLSARALRIEPRCLYQDRYVYRLDSHNRLEAVNVTRLGVRMLDGKEVVLIASPALSEGDRLLKTRLTGALTGQQVTPVDLAVDDS